MSLIYFHRFLIACAILFALTMSWHLIQEWRAGGAVWSLVTGIGCCVGGAVLALYLKSVRLPSRPARS